MMNKLDVNGIEMAAVDRGRGTPLLLVHGFPLDHSMWNVQVESLGERCRVIAPDLRGFGQSGVSEGKVTMAQFADDLAALLDALAIDEPVVFCGLSMGGYVAWEFLRRHRARVKALILCDTRAAADSPEAAAGRLKTADEVSTEGPAAVASLADGMLPRLLAEQTLRDRPELVESLGRVMRSTDPRAVAAALRGMAERRDATAMLSEIDCPTLVIVGRHDAISGVAEMALIAESIRGARLVEISAAGHMSPLENPAEVNAAIGEFLAAMAP
jgi:pimeloyl-ACP methyl ester carboxylesterase